jgi:hyperosmotically inducible periplasmic protein
MKTTPARIFAGIAIAGVVLIACDDRTDRSVGQKIDSALAQTKESLSRAGDKIAQQTDKAVTAVKKSTDGNDAAKTGNGSSAPASTKPMSDTAITASIKTDLLKDPDLSVLKIDVDTKQGVVTLNGLADNEEARQRAEKIAEGVKGVREVRNYLVTKRV